MPLTSIRFASLSFAIVLLCFCLACATEKGDRKAEHPQEDLSAQEESRQAWDEQIVRSPWVISGEYFSQKEKGDGVDLRKWWQGRKELEAKQEETEKRLAELEEAVKEGPGGSQSPDKGPGLQAMAAQASPAPAVQSKAASAETLRFKVATVIFPQVYKAASDKREALLQAVRTEFARRPGLLLVGPEEVEEILVQQGLVVRPKDIEKIALALGTYPVTRLVVFIDELTLHRKDGKLEGSMDYNIVDGFSGRSITEAQEVGSASSGPDGENKVLRELVAPMAVSLEKRAAQYAWFSRVAMVQGKRVYLSAGEASGLKRGDILSVYGPGRDIVHPVAKVSMGFQRGPYKGEVRVLKLFGRDSAEAALVGGKGNIEGNDLVALPEVTN